MLVLKVRATREAIHQRKCVSTVARFVQVDFFVLLLSAALSILAHKLPMRLYQYRATTSDYITTVHKQNTNIQTFSTQVLHSSHVSLAKICLNQSYAVFEPSMLQLRENKSEISQT